MSVNQTNITAYGLSQPLPQLPPQPIVAKRNPNTHDFAPIGTIWCNDVASTTFILASIINNTANWITASGGTGLFSSLTVNPGPTNLSTVGNGAVTIGHSTNTGAITLSVGSGGFALVGNTNTIQIGADANANSVIIGSNTAGTTVDIIGGNGTGIGTSALELQTAAAGDIQIGNPAHTGTIRMGVSTAGENILIGNSAGAEQIIIGSVAAGAVTVLQADQAESSTGALNLNAGGNVGVQFLPKSVGSPTATLSIVTNVGQATFTGFTTAAAASQVFTITNALVTAAASIFVTAMNKGANDAQMTVTRVVPLAGSFTVTVTNFGTQALNGDVIINFWVL